VVDLLGSLKDVSKRAGKTFRGLDDYRFHRELVQIWDEGEEALQKSVRLSISIGARRRTAPVNDQFYRN
jgi:hypothetical protein